MRFIQTPLAGAYVIELERQEDERGSFARSWCEDEFRAKGLDAHVAQCNISYNRRKGTIRGMHYQAAPHAETKVVRCTMGAIYDVIVDLRTDSSTRRRWFAIELTAENRRMLYVPAQFAHGFVTLTDNSEILYQMGMAFAPEASRGFLWNDPSFGIEWPVSPTLISERDRSWPLEIA